MENFNFDFLPYESRYTQEKRAEAKHKKGERIALVLCLLAIAFIVYLFSNVYNTPIN